VTRLLALVWPELRAHGSDTSPFERMLDALDDLSPRVEPIDVGVALVDVTGLEVLHGPERRVAARAVALVRAVAPLSVRAGIGDNRWLAVLAARLARPATEEAPAAFHALPTGSAAVREALRELPLTLLPADPVARQRFVLFGLTTMGQLADLPRSSVGAQFGRAGERLQALARGEEARPLVPRRRPERVETTVAFEPPIDGIGAVGLTLRRLCAELCERLRNRHLAPGRASLTLSLEDAPALSVAQPFPQPALEPDWIARLLLSRIEAAARARLLSSTSLSGDTRLERPSGHSKPGQIPVAGSRNAHTTTTIGEWQEPASEAHEPRVVSVLLAFDRLSDPASSQLSAFEARAGRWEELRWSLERIRHRFGEGRLWRAVVDRPTAALPEDRSRLVDIGP
jgi:nucleotidyltransferase/DNA polymerase involved in DNA repair